MTERLEKRQAMNIQDRNKDKNITMESVGKAWKYAYSDGKCSDFRLLQDYLYGINQGYTMDFNYYPEHKIRTVSYVFDVLGFDEAEEVFNTLLSWDFEHVSVFCTRFVIMFVQNFEQEIEPRIQADWDS